MPALPSQKADLDLGLIQPAAVFGRVVDRQSVPKLGPFLFPEVVGKSFGAMDVQIIHDQMDRVGSGVVGDDALQRRSQLRSRAIWSCQREVFSSLRLYRAEYVGRSASLVFVVGAPGLTRGHRPCRSYVIVECDWLLVQTNHRLCRVVWSFIDFEHRLHLFQVLVGEVRHGRGRDAGHPAPPAQIPTSGTTA